MNTSYIDNCRFELEDHGIWLQYLEDNGFVVIKSVIKSVDEIEQLKNNYWNVIETCEEIKRDDMKTWDNWYLDRRGIITDGNYTHCEAAWKIRTLPAVKEAFSKIWKSEDLIVSMDSVLIWKPWWYNENWKPRCEGIHLDQNIREKPGLECVQGIVPLYDVTPSTGGTAFVRKSHLPHIQNTLCASHNYWRGDFCPISKNDPLQGREKLVLAKAGDLILWDSRTAHCGKIGTMEDQINDLPRLSQTVCMTKRSRASKSVIKTRKEGFRKGWSFTHWPHEDMVSGYSTQYTPIKLTNEQRALL